MKLNTKQIGVFAFIFLITYLFFNHIFYQDREGIWSSFYALSSDWAVHSSYISHLSRQPIFDWLSQNPIYAGASFYYPIGVHVFSLILKKMNFYNGLILPSVICFSVVVILIYLFLNSLLVNPKKSLVGTLLFLLSGGLGFFWYLESIPLMGSSIREFYTNYESVGLQLPNIVTLLLIPQKAYLAGLVLFLIAVLQIQKNSRLILALSAILLTVTHPHLYLAFIIYFSLSVFFRKNYKNMVILIPSLLVFAIYYHNVQSGSFIKLAHGWMSVSEFKIHDLIIFWLKNWGVFGILTTISLTFLDNSKFRIPVLFGSLMFVLSNIIQFQPNFWDNSKFLTLSYLMFCFPVVELLNRLWVKTKLTTALLFVLCVFSGALSIGKLLVDTKNPQLLWSAKDLERADKIKTFAPSSDVFATTTNHLNIISTLVGNPIVMGYEGWIASYGLEWSKRLDDLKKLYSGESVKEICNRYKIKFVVIGPLETQQFLVNREYFSKNLQKIYTDESYDVFKVIEESAP